MVSPANAAYFTADMDARQRSLPAGRNRDPILAVLKRVVPRGARVLEIASGSGEHAMHFARHLNQVLWQPSDPDPEARASIAAWIEAEAARNVDAPLAIDVTQENWSDPLAGRTFETVVAINMIHISPWEATLGLVRGASAVLASATRGPAKLYTYGPYKREGRHTAPSNEAFDEWLKQRDSRFGVRDVEEVEAAAKVEGLRLHEIVEMPANNLSLIFEPTHSA
jgi:cyclopropane fatty-acyl-phospholipid synthase-like methyltransferase